MQAFAGRLPGRGPLTKIYLARFHAYCLARVRKNDQICRSSACPSNMAPNLASAQQNGLGSRGIIKLTYNQMQLHGIAPLGLQTPGVLSMPEAKVRQDSLSPH